MINDEHQIGGKQDDRLYSVLIGEDLFRVMALDNQKAAYKAAGIFKERYDLSCPLSDITYYANTKLAPANTTKAILTKLIIGEKSRAEKD